MELAMYSRLFFERPTVAATVVIFYKANTEKLAESKNF